MVIFNANNLISELKKTNYVNTENIVNLPISKKNCENTEKIVNLPNSYIYRGVQHQIWKMQGYKNSSPLTLMKTHTHNTYPR